MACPPDKIMNPSTGRCVLITGALGRKLLGASKCDETTQVLNPTSSRCVLKSGKIGKAILAQLQQAGPSRPVAPQRRPAIRTRNSPSTNLGNVGRPGPGSVNSTGRSGPRGRSRPRKSAAPRRMVNAAMSTRTKLLNRLKSTCHNDSDPVSLDEFKGMTDKQLSSIVKLGAGKRKKNCYELDTMYEVYKTAVKDNRPVRDPLNPGYTVTPKEIDSINRLMRKRNPNYQPPRRQVMEYPRGAQLRFTPDGRFYRIVVDGVVPRLDLGVVPGDIGVADTGSLDSTSEVLLAGIQQLWDARRLLVSADPVRCCVVHLRKEKQYWQGPDKIRKFLNMIDEVRQLLG